MPLNTYPSRELEFKYSLSDSTNENRLVTNYHAYDMSHRASLIFPSGTGSYQLWATNRRPYDIHVTNPEQMMINQFQMQDLMNRNVPYQGFSSSWINVTLDTNAIQLAASAMYVNYPYRFLRIQGPALTGATTAASIAFLWTSYSIIGG